MIIVRADGNNAIGTGHLMRCLSIMEQAKKKDHILFLLADESGKEIVESKGFKCKVLYTNYKDMESELLVFANAVSAFQVDMIVVDSYQVTSLYLDELSKMAPITLVEDVMRNVYKVDNIINYNIYANQDNYRNKYENFGNKKTRFYTGISFVPLRKEFATKKYIVRKDVKDIFISAGGSDPLNYAGEILLMFISNEKFKAYNYHVISGIFNKNKAFLYDIKKKYDNVYIYENVSNIAEIMRKCDVAISAAGSTMYELASVGIPIITFAFVDNQDKIARSFGEQNLALFAGDSFTEMNEILKKIDEKIELLASDFQLRINISRRLQKEVDGEGAKRLFEIITNGKEDTK